MKLRQFTFILVLLFFMNSCQTVQKTEQNDLNYLQNIVRIATEALENMESKNTIQPGDQLAIIVSAKDMVLAAPFNQSYTAAEVVESGNSNSSNAKKQGNYMAPSYIVDDDGNIDFPNLGTINTTGITIDELKNNLTERLKYYLKNPSVSVRLANFRVTVLGEVNRQGEYIIPNGRGNLLNALAMAGDLSMYGERNNVLLIRNVDGVMSKQRIDLTDAGFITSPYYNLKQGDVIYVPSNKTKDKTSKLNPNTPMYISVAGIIVTIMALLFR